MNQHSVVTIFLTSALLLSHYCTALCVKVLKIILLTKFIHCTVTISEISNSEQYCFDELYAVWVTVWEINCMVPASIEVHVCPEGLAGLYIKACITCRIEVSQKLLNLHTVWVYCYTCKSMLGNLSQADTSYSYNTCRSDVFDLY